MCLGVPHLPTWFANLSMRPDEFSLLASPSYFRRRWRWWIGVGGSIGGRAGGKQSGGGNGWMGMLGGYP